MFKKNARGQAPDVRCAFCQKTQDDVRMLVAGPSVYICDECVDICVEIIRRGLSPAPEVQEGALANELPPVGVTGPAVRCALCRMPTPVDDGVLIPNRGVLCPGCIGEIEATIAEKKQAGL